MIYMMINDIYKLQNVDLSEDIIWRIWWIWWIWLMWWIGLFCLMIDDMLDDMIDDMIDDINWSISMISVILKKLFL